MDFKKYRRLKKAAQRSANLGAFMREVGSSSSWYGVPLWSKKEYADFFERFKAGARFPHFKAA